MPDKVWNCQFCSIDFYEELVSFIEGTILNLSYSSSFFVGPFLHALKLWGGVVAYEILVSAQGPLVFGFLGLGAKGLGPGLDNKHIQMKVFLPSILPPKSSFL